MLNTILCFLKDRILPDRKHKHTRWLIARLPHMMQIDDPKLFDLVEYQKEGLLVLAASARKTQEAFEEYSKKPQDHDLERSYQALRNIYTYDVETLQLAHPVFNDLEIHWSKLPEFIKKWQAKNPKAWDQKAAKRACVLVTA
ncbi:MAG: hypothetical protein PHG25_03465 [Candidatus Pacebacteria bacterium]|nr:hypothetical protein [Candidatus Paceibacterota bacterium]